jgi:hypothetical protein
MMNGVYIFGAGASKDFGLPLGIEVFDRAYNLATVKTEFIACQDLQSLLCSAEKYLREIFTNLPDDKKRYPPMEEVLTFLWECKNSERYDYDKNKLISMFDHPHYARGVFDIFTKILALTLAGSMQVDRPSARISTFREFIKTLLLDRECNTSFISLNYDLLLDDALSECVSSGIIEDYTYAAPVSNITEPYRSSSSQVMRRRRGVFLLKPHGSLNMVSCDHHQARYGEGFYISDTEPIATVADTLKCPGCGSAPKPLIIPPLYNKADYVAASAFKSSRFTWRATPERYRLHCDPKIRELLTAADEITVIGYSLPAYDFDFKGLLITSLMKNPKRSKVRLRLVTKGGHALVRNLTAQLERLVGSVDVVSKDGFYKYLRVEQQR